MFSGLTQKINLIYLSDHSHVMYVTVRRIWGGGETTLKFRFQIKKVENDIKYIKYKKK